MKEMMRSVKRCVQTWGGGLIKAQLPLEQYWLPFSQNGCSLLLCPQKALPALPGSIAASSFKFVLIPALSTLLI